MRFTISREKLQEGLAAVAASIPAKTTLPVLANILVETTDKGIRLSGTDLDIAVSTEVAADVEAPGAITIPRDTASFNPVTLSGNPRTRAITLTRTPDAKNIRVTRPGCAPTAIRIPISRIRC